MQFEHMSTDVGVDSSSRFALIARTDRQTHTRHKATDAADHPNHATATVGVGNAWVKC